MKTPALTTLTLALAFASTSFAGTADTASKEPVMPTPAPATDAGIFLGGEVGKFWLQNFSVGAPLAIDFKFKSGYSFDVPVGYDFGNGLSVALSAGYDRVNFQQLTGYLDERAQTASTQGRFAFIPVLGNASYSFKLVGNLSWYIGGGIGAVHETASFHTYDSHTHRSITFGQLGSPTAYFNGITEQEWKFGYQAFTGLSYALCRNASVNAGYRFMQVDSHVSVNDTTGHKLEGQGVEVGMLVKF